MTHDAAAPLSEAWVKSVGQHIDAEPVADAMVSAWQSIDRALRPIIGTGGVAALYQRSLDLSVPNHPWLAGTYEGLEKALDAAPLQAALAQQSCADGIATGGALLQMFCRLLAGLVGPSLTEQLLLPVTHGFSRGEHPEHNAP
jgi:hypothetical protein